MFQVGERERLRAALIQAARDDERVDAGALLGSAAIDREDAWSDIDLALRVTAEHEIAAVIADWTDAMYTRHGAVHHFDVRYHRTTYRVFLLASTLQVDVSFWAREDFAAAGPKFRLLFGDAGDVRLTAAPDLEEQAGLVWLYLLHVRSSIGRGRLLQADYMLAAARTHVLTIACVRRDLPASDGRGFDDLPSEVRGRAARCVPPTLEPDALRRAATAVAELLLEEVVGFDARLAERLGATVRELVA